MTQSPSFCSSLDAYLDGDLADADARAFETHAQTCSECTADLAATRLLDAEWARLATTTAPVGLIDSALREAKQGTRDRQPVPPSRRRMGRFASVVAFGVLLVALASTALWMQRDNAPVPALQASADPPATIDSVESPLPEPIPAEEITPQLDPPSSPPSPRATPARQPAPARRSQPAPPPVPVEAPVQLVQQVSPADSVAQAKDDLMLALSLVADAQSRAGTTVSTEIGRAAGALSESSVF